jgi:hypothetical protein
MLAEEYQQWEGDWELIYGSPYAIPSYTVTHQNINGCCINFDFSKIWRKKQ